MRTRTFEWQAAGAPAVGGDREFLEFAEEEDAGVRAEAVAAQLASTTGSITIRQCMGDHLNNDPSQNDVDIDTAIDITPDAADE